MNEDRPVVICANGSRLAPGGGFKIVWKDDLIRLAGPVKGHSGADRRAAQLIREAWNKLPDFPDWCGRP
jgi:hypothetical protein